MFKGQIIFRPDSTSSPALKCMQTKSSIHPSTFHSTTAQLNNQETQDFTDRSLGRFFRTFASLEFALSLRIGGTGNFQDKLERFYEKALTQHPDSDTYLAEVSAWYKAANSLRMLRNRFAHGRWGFPTKDCIVHVAGYPPDLQDERRFSAAELNSIVQDAELLEEELSKLVRRI